MASHSTSFGVHRFRQDDSWVEISSQPSSSSLSSANDDFVSPDRRLHQPPLSTLPRRRRHLRPTELVHKNSSLSVGATSSQEEYDESESESDRVMTSSNEGPTPRVAQQQSSRRLSTTHEADQHKSSDDDEDESRTAINYPIQHVDVSTSFMPQPNAFNRPVIDSERRHSSVPGSYFPRHRPATRQSNRHSYSAPSDHLPRNLLSPSYNAALQHEEALRASLTTLLSCAAAARGLPRSTGDKKTAPVNPSTSVGAPRSDRIEPLTLRLVPESELPASVSSPPQFQEPKFHPTLRRGSTSTSASSHENKRKAAAASRRSTSRESRAMKKARRSLSSDELGMVSPTLLTWVVSAGVVVFLSALSFTAGYSLGKEVGRLDASEVAGLSGDVDDRLISCAHEAGRSGLGLKRTLARSAVQV